MNSALYTYAVTWEAEDEVFVGRVAEFPSLAAHGETQEEALREIRELVEFVLADLQESGEPIPEPLSTKSFSGRFNVRIPPHVHRQLATQARFQGISMNQLVLSKLVGG